MVQRNTAAAVQSALANLRSLSGLSELFNSTLNYQLETRPLITRDWTAQRATELLREGRGRIVASHDDFQIIYCQIPRLLLTHERPIMNQVLRHVSPYALVVFADQRNEHWHFVNVKYDEEAEKRRVFRRITVSADDRLHTAAQRIAMLEITDEAISPLALQTKHDEAFDVEPVTREFYERYKDLFSWTMDLIRGEHSHRETHAFTQQLFNRMMFLYFVQKLYWEHDGERRYWLNDDAFYMKNLFERYRALSRTDQFLEVWLEGLFFEAFRHRYGFQVFDLPQPVKDEFAKMPWLNGGLFEKNKWDRVGVRVPDVVFERLYDELLEHFNFTVREDTPVDIEVAVDPVMLGHVYESLIAEEERGRAGIFYTEATELDFMCRRALIESLDGRVPLATDELIGLVLDVVTPEELPEYEPAALAAVRQQLDEVKVVDPACGSGAFLVTMMNVMTQLHEFIAVRAGQQFNPFELKKKIIADNLYGVDIKEWACRVAELRLWLSLIVETEGRHIDMYLRPLLPNLDYKIRQGDSLVEEIEGQSLSLRGKFTAVSRRLAPMITRFIRRKDDFFYNRDDRGVMIADLKRLEMQILWGVIDSKLQVVNQALGALESQAAAEFRKQLSFLGAQAEQAELFEETEEARNRQEKRRAWLAEQKTRLLDAKGAIGKKRERDYFLWDIDFAEIFQDRGGFDIVIGNPPYVRQEAIAPQNLVPDEITPEIKKEYKQQLIRSVHTLWGKDVKIDKRSDLYLYFYFHGLGLLRPGGVFSFITSNSWLDVGYGACLQSFLLKQMKVKAIYDNLAKRSFVASDVNTVITLFQRPESGEEVGQHAAKFVAFMKPLEDVVTVENLSVIGAASGTITTDDYRMRAISQEKLFVEGLEGEPEAETGGLDLAALRSIYVGSKWGGKYLRSPDVFLELLRDRESDFVPLSRIADISRGVTTGAVNFFILSPDTAEQFHVEKQYLHPVLKSSRTLNHYVVRGPDEVKHTILLVHESRETLRGTGALQYIMWGERQGYHQSQTCAARAKRSTTYGWYDLEAEVETGPCFAFPARTAVTYKFIHNPEGFALNDNLYRVVPKQGMNIALLGAVLNSTLTYLAVELQGRTNLGEGALKVQVYELARCPVVDPARFSASVSDAVARCYRELSKRRVESVFTELQMPDRRDLDLAIFRHFGIEANHLEELYNATTELARDRLQKAESV